MDLSVAHVSKEEHEEFENAFLTTLRQVGTTNLTTLVLPERYSPSARCLMAIFDANPHLESLSLFLTDVVSDDEQRLKSPWIRWVCQMANRKSLKQLSLTVSGGSSTEPPPTSASLGAGDGGPGLQSLSFKAIDVQSPHVWLGHETHRLLSPGDTPSLMRMNLFIVPTSDFEKLLFDNPHLETLKVLLWERDIPKPSVNQFFSPLRSLNLSLNCAYVEDILPEVLRVIRSRTILEDLSITPDYYFCRCKFFEYPDCGCSWNDSTLKPKFLTTQLATSPDMWSKLTAIFFSLESGKEWDEFLSIMSKLNRLKKLHLQLGCEFW